MKKKFKNIMTITFLVLLTFSGTYFYFQRNITTHTESFSSTVSESVLRILQLSTMQYNYTDVVSYKQSNKFNNVKIPFTEKKFLIKYTGYIKAGIDLKDVTIVVPDPDTVHITMNHAQITDNVINEEDIYVYDEKESIFNQLKISDVYDVLVDEKNKTENKIIENGFLEEADKRTQELITEVLKSMNFKNIVIDFL